LGPYYLPGIIQIWIQRYKDPVSSKILPSNRGDKVVYSNPEQIRSMGNCFNHFELNLRDRLGVW
jgi:hypothetical protein